MKHSRRRATQLVAVVSLILFASFSSAQFSRSRTRASTEAAPQLSREDIEKIMQQAVLAADRVASANGLRSNDGTLSGPVVRRPTKMVIAIVQRDGKVTAVHAMPDAWIGSQDIAIAKGRTAAFFSSDENALTSRIIGELSQAHKTDGTGAAGPLWGIGNSNQVGITGTKEYRNGIITFPGGVPVYKDGRLAGAVGVSGDAVDQDEAVAFAAAAGFDPGPNTVRLGYKTPQVPMVSEQKP